MDAGSFSMGFREPFIILPSAFDSAQVEATGDVGSFFGKRLAIISHTYHERLPIPP